MNIGFFGGTFSPPHKGHLHSARVFAKECGLDKLIIIPAKVSPFKTGCEITAEDTHRLEMTRLCFEASDFGNTDVEISDFEIIKNETSYTYLTLKHLLSLFSSCKLYMFVGSDMFLSLENWKNIEHIFKNCTIYTRARDLNELDLLYEHKQKYENSYNARIIISQDKPLLRPLILDKVY